MANEEDTQIKIELHDHVDIPIRYASLERVYSVSSSSSSLCSHNVISKKVNAAHKLPMSDAFQGYGCPDDFDLPPHRRPEIFHVYCRRKRRRRERNERKDGIVKIEDAELDENDFYEEAEKKQRKRRIGNGELMKLGVDSTTLSISTTPRLRGCRIKQNGSSRSKMTSFKNQEKVLPASSTAKKWVRLSYDGVDPTAFIGLQCKVFWPLDAQWYPGSIIGYNVDQKHHIIKYGDGDGEELVLHREKIKFLISREEMGLLNLKFGTNSLAVGGQDYDEMVVLAASFEGCQDFVPKDIIWAKLTG